MKFKKDQIWKSRDGHTLKIININDAEDTYKVKAIFIMSDSVTLEFTNEGCFYSNELEDMYDLVELIGDIETYPEYFL